MFGILFTSARPATKKTAGSHGVNNLSVLTDTFCLCIYLDEFSILCVVVSII